MQLPFTKEQIHNYLKLYGGIVIIMILFFIAANNFYSAKNYDKKVFKADTQEQLKEKKQDEVNKKMAVTPTESTSKYRLLDKAY
jgi:hypothetical protein